MKIRFCCKVKARKWKVNTVLLQTVSVQEEVITAVSPRHEKYRTQYRAMFVMNCLVKRDEVLRYKTQQEKKQRKRKRRRQQQEAEPATDEAEGAGPSGMDADEVYHPVKCSECSTEVAVLDKEEVYHFFNILASHC